MILNQHLISTPAAPLHPDQTVENALLLLEDLDVTHWPMVDAGIFKGLVAEEYLMDHKNEVLLNSILSDLLPFSVLADDHFLSAARLRSERRLSVVPVTDKENAYLGVIQYEELLAQLTQLIGAHETGGLIVLESSPHDFSPGEIIRLVETNDAQIRQLNSHLDEVSGKLIVTIKINKLEVSDIVATLQRYDYSIIYFAGEEQYENEIRRNYNHLLHFMEM